MKTYQTLALLSVSFSLSFTAIAHEHGSHKEDHGTSKYDCEAVNKMDHSKMDMNDPEMHEMMKACSDHDNKSDSQHGHGQHDTKGNHPHNNGH